MKNFLFIYKTKKNYIGYNLKDMSYYYLENIYLEKSENKICRLTIKNENYINGLSQLRRRSLRNKKPPAMRVRDKS